MKATKIPFIGAILFLFLMAGLVCSSQTVQAARETQLYASIPLEDNLIALKGKSVTVTLFSGKQLTGIVKEVKNKLLHLERLSLKDFYDALIRIDHISAIEARVRQE